jgi:hypothetical protein
LRMNPSPSAHIVLNLSRQCRQNCNTFAASSLPPNPAVLSKV